MSQAVIDYLKKLPLFAGLHEGEIGELYPTMGLVKHPRPGHVVFDLGDKPDGAYILTQGACVLSLPVEGGEPREVVRLGPGAVVGELCLVRPAPRSLRLSVVEPTDFIVIHGPAFHRLRQARSPAAYKLLRNVGLMVCQRLRDTNELLEMEWRGEKRAPRVDAPLGAPRKEGAWRRLLGFFAGTHGGAS